MIIVSKQIQPSKQEVQDTLSVFLQQHPKLHFACIKSRLEFNQVKALRLKIYNENLPYMLNQIHESGSDEYDDRSLIFAISYNNSMIASIRATPYPFETLNYIDQSRLTDFLGPDWRNSYLEWSRLLVDTSFKLKRLVNLLTIYAGLYILTNTNYMNYFGYARPRVKRILSRFRLSDNALSFMIPNRGTHEYLLIKGSFADDFLNLKTVNSNNHHHSTFNAVSNPKEY